MKGLVWTVLTGEVSAGRDLIPPGGAGVRYVGRKVVGFDRTGHYQQVLNVELFEGAVGADTGKRGRVLRVGTAGTVIDSSGLLTTKGQTHVAVYPESLVSGGGVKQLAWRAVARDPHYPAELSTVLDTDEHGWVPGLVGVFTGYSFQIGTADFDTSRVASGMADSTHKAQDWLLDQVSPKPMNEQISVTTSTSVGTNQGFFGMMLQAGVDYNWSTANSWTVTDFRLLGDGGALVTRPNATWTLRHTDRTGDGSVVPDLSRGAVLPVLEAVFELKPGVAPRRYSLLYSVARLGVNRMGAYQGKAAVGEFAGNPFWNAAVDAKGVRNHARYLVAFVQCLVVDWTAGQVWATTADPFEPLPTLLATGTAHEIGSATAPDPEKGYGDPLCSLSTFWDTNAYRFHAYPADTYRDVLAPRIPDDRPVESVPVVGEFGFVEGSSVGVVVFTTTGAGVPVAVQMPESWPDVYPYGFLVRSSDTTGSWDYEWRPGDRRLLLRPQSGVTGHAVWVVPAGTATGTCVRFDPVARTATPLFPVGDLGFGLDEAPDACLVRHPGTPGDGQAVVFWRGAVFVWSATDRVLRAPRALGPGLITGLPEGFTGGVDAALWCQDGKGSTYLLIKDGTGAQVRVSDPKTDPVRGAVAAIKPLTDWFDLTDHPEFAAGVDAAWNDPKDLAGTPTAHLVRGERHATAHLGTDRWTLTGAGLLSDALPGVTAPVTSCLVTKTHHYIFARPA